MTGQEIATLHAAGYTNAGYDGAGVKIGIIDGGFAGYAARLGTELPASVTTQDFCGTGSRPRPPTDRPSRRSCTRSRPAPSST